MGFGLGGYLLGLGFGDPRADDYRVCSRLEALAVLADLGVILCDPRLCNFGPRECCGVIKLSRQLGELIKRRIGADGADGAEQLGFSSRSSARSPVPPKRTQPLRLRLLPDAVATAPALALLARRFVR